jgi:hypothetical protein
MSGKHDPTMGGKLRPAIDNALIQKSDCHADPAGRLAMTTFVSSNLQKLTGGQLFLLRGIKSQPLLAR